jgi:hypothetical protein
MKNWLGRSVAQAFSRGFPQRRPGFDPRQDNVGFIVQKVARGVDFLRVLRFPLTRLIPPTLQTRLPFGAGTAGSLVVTIGSGPSSPPHLTLPHELEIKADELIGGSST